MTSPMELMQPMIKYKDVPIQNITINTNGFFGISSYMPAITNFLFAMVVDWSGNSSKAAFTVTADGKYILATADQSFTYVTVRYFYTD